MMKYFFTLIVCALMACVLPSCSDDDQAPVNPIEVSPMSLDGTWMLTEWNGAALLEGQYVYITFTRRDHTFVMYDNMNSMYSHRRSGSYTMSQDEKKGFVLTGEYDYELGDWGSYIVTEMKADRMVLMKEGTAAEVSVYTRTNGVPSDIEKGSRSAIR